MSPERSGFDLRDLTHADAAALARLDQRSQGSPWSARQFADELGLEHSGGFGLFFVDDQTRLAGYLIYRAVLDEWELLNVVSAPELRRQGLGLRLVKTMIARARAQTQQARRILLEVRSRNQAAITLYQQLGFKRDGLRKKYYRDDGDDALLMSLNIL